MFVRDGGKCVFCSAPAVDAHHIMERRLWPDGGYYLDNGASVCEEHHLACERTDISTEAVRDACGIERALLPPHLEKRTVYDKWGNPVLPDGRRLRGELFRDESVQKILSGHLSLFTSWVKYPRTAYLPWSPGADQDLAMDPSVFEGRNVVVTEKMDGENTTLYRDYIHARSLDSRHHESRDWVKKLQSEIGWEIPEGWRICGENLWAKHSIEYTDLPSYFLAFSIWDEFNVCLRWAHTREWLEMLGLTPVRVLYEGVYSESAIKDSWDGRGEGYVVRATSAISYSDFRRLVGKYVRPDHVQTHGHWMRSTIVKNGLKSG